MAAISVAGPPRRRRRAAEGTDVVDERGPGKAFVVHAGRVRVPSSTVPGTLPGKAIEPLAQGTGEILVRLTLQ